MTISESDVKEIARPSGSSSDSAPEEEGVSREAAERMLRYLLFHRSLIGEGDGHSEVLQRYLSLVRNLREGVHVVISDPFQKATALLFELVLEEEFDPWEIDLVRFTQLYLEKVRDQSLIDFAVAGRLVCMAWSILYLQSREVLRTRESMLAPSESSAGPPTVGDFLSELDIPTSDELTDTVLESPDAPPLEQMVRHTETRPVSLLELVQAFGEAEENARRQLRIEELRERLKAEQSSPPEVLVHGDIPERDLADLWAIALRHPVDRPFEFLGCWRPAEGRDRLVALFLASLFLSREEVLELRQANLDGALLELVRRANVRPMVREN